MRGAQADLDAAVSNAYQQRVGAEAGAVRADADRAAAELAEAEEMVRVRSIKPKPFAKI